MTFIDILWAIVSVFLAVFMAAGVITFAVAVTWLEVMEGSGAHESTQR